MSLAPVLTMTLRELDRVDVMRRIHERRLSQVRAAEQLGLTVRQVERLYRAYKADGPAALSSKKRGRRSNRKLSDELRRECLKLVRERYLGFGPTLAHEKLTECHGVQVSVETLRKWMLIEGLWDARADRAKRVQQPRPRRPCRGELVQIDGCNHAWFEERGPKCVLLVYVDDATSELMELRFVPSESTFEYFASTRSYLERHGKPVAFYSDKAGVFRVNAKAPKGGDGFTQFGRAMHDLNIDVICANTAPAKGRVERAHQTLQDRLVKELRLRNICNAEDGNAFLPHFMADYNRRFGRTPQSSHDAHRRPLRESEQLAEVFQWKEQRKLRSNLTLHYKRTLYLIEPSDVTNKLRGKHVQVCEAQDGTVKIVHRGLVLPARAFLKDGAITQAAVVENKLLGTALESIRQKQLERDKQKLRARSLNLRDKELLRRFLEDREESAQNIPASRTPTVDSLLRHALQALQGEARMPGR